LIILATLETGATTIQLTTSNSTEHSTLYSVINTTLLIDNETETITGVTISTTEQISTVSSQITTITSLEVTTQTEEGKSLKIIHASNALYLDWIFHTIPSNKFRF
jgi:hypothetical protein